MLLKMNIKYKGNHPNGIADKNGNQGTESQIVVHFVMHLKLIQYFNFNSNSGTTQ